MPDSCLLETKWEMCRMPLPYGFLPSYGMHPISMEVSSILSFPSYSRDAVYDFSSFLSDWKEERMISHVSEIIRKVTFFGCFFEEKSDLSRMKLLSIDRNCILKMIGKWLD